MTIRINCANCGCDFDAPESVTIPGVCGSNDLICDECAMDIRDGGMGDDVSEFDDEPDFCDDEPWDGFRDDVEADADVLRMAGMGDDEDYGHYGDDFGYDDDGRYDY